MGSFWGHIDEGLFFIIIAVWWILKACYDYIMNEDKGQDMTPRISYALKCKREIPIEIMFKLLFPIVGFLGEMFDGEPRFQDEQGNFLKLVYMQHMTIYGIFILHSIIDLLTWIGVPMLPGANYLSAALSFLWYGVAFYYHASMHGKEPLETIVHVLPIYVMFVTAGAILLEVRWQSGVWTMLARAYCVLTLGTWFSHVAFMLYEHDKFPGGGTSGWQRDDIRNVQYARACFGLHLLINMLFIFICYCVTYFVLRMRHKVRITVTYFDKDHDVRVKPYNTAKSGSGSDESMESFLLQENSS